MLSAHLSSLSVAQLLQCYLCILCCTVEFQLAVQVTVVFVAWNFISLVNALANVVASQLVELIGGAHVCYH